MWSWNQRHILYRHAYSYHAHNRASHWSWTIGRATLDREVHLVPKLNYYYQQRFFVLLTIISLDAMYCNFASAYKIITLIEVKTLPLVWTNCWSQHGLHINDRELKFGDDSNIRPSCCRQQTMNRGLMARSMDSTKLHPYTELVSQVATTSSFPSPSSFHHVLTTSPKLVITSVQVRLVAMLDKCGGKCMKSINQHQ